MSPGPLLGDAAGEPVHIDDPAPVDAARDRLDIVMGLNLEGHDGPVHVDDPGAAGHGEALRRGGEVLDLDEGADAPLVLLQAGGDRVGAAYSRWAISHGVARTEGIRWSTKLIRFAALTTITCSPVCPVRGMDFMASDLTRTCRTPGTLLPGTGPISRSCLMLDPDRPTNDNDYR